MAKAYFVSDSYANTGPAIVNKYYKKYLNSREYVFAKHCKSKVSRVVNDIYHILKSKVIVFSGASKADILYMKLCKILRRKMIYIMHGCIQEENKINCVKNESETQLELLYLKNVDLILGVSERFVKWIESYYPQVKGKIQSLPNGVDWEIDLPQNCNCVLKSNTIAIVGGGIPRKNVLSVCKAVDELRNETKTEYVLKVFGRDDLYTEQIKQYAFVKYYGKIPRKEMFSELQDSCLFIQNSIFESFGMAPLEALMLECNVLCSANVGSLSIITTLEESDMIKECSDVQEIKEKIQYNMEHPNHNRLMEGLDKERTSFKARAKELEQYIEQVIL